MATPNTTASASAVCWNPIAEAHQGAGADGEDPARVRIRRVAVRQEPGEDNHGGPRRGPDEQALGQGELGLEHRQTNRQGKEDGGHYRAARRQQVGREHTDGQQGHKAAEEGERVQAGFAWPEQAKRDGDGPDLERRFVRPGAGVQRRPAQQRAGGDGIAGFVGVPVRLKERGEPADGVDSPRRGRTRPIGERLRRRP